MSEILNTKATCQKFYHLGDAIPTKSQRNHITELCRKGAFVCAFRIGREWFVDWDEEKKKGMTNGK